MNLLSARSLVIKIGSALVVDQEKGSPNVEWLESLVDDIHKLTQQNIRVVLVSSGAIAYGNLSFNLPRKNLSLDSKQALAAIGQIELMHQYQQLLNKKGMKAAQVLLNLHDTEDRRRYINLKNTLNRLLDLGVVPIINENDSMATSEIRYGDNDRLAARVAQLIDADTLVLLSDIDGFYTDDPRLNKKATLIQEIESLTPEILNMAKDSSSNYGSGGMVTKLKAAEMVVNSGCHLLIAAGCHNHPISHFLDTQKGTWFRANTTKKSAKKNWIAHHLHLEGSITIDEGAGKALNKGSSLLAAGVIQTEGTFQKGAPIRVLNASQQEIARGLSNYSSHDLLKIMGKKTPEFEAILGYMGSDTLVHRDNLVSTEESE